jgi:hypothetical protein
MQLENAHGEGIVNLKTVQRWISKFCSGKTDLDDEPRPRRLRRNGKLPVTRAIIEEGSYLSQKKIVQTLSLHQDSVLDSLKKKLAQIPDPNLEKGHVLNLDNAEVPQLAFSDQMSLIPDLSVRDQNGICWCRSDLGKK